MLRFSLKDDSSVQLPKQNRKHHSKKHSSGTRNSDGSGKYIDIDIGTPTCIRVSLDTAAEYRCIHSSKYSKLFQIRQEDGSSETLVVRWMDPTCSSSDRDDVAISAVTDKSIVPEYEGKQRFMHQGAYVSVGLRRYIEGQPLSMVMKTATPEQMDHYKLQVSSIVTQLANITSSHYGTVLDGNLKTSRIPAYISAHHMIEKLKNSKYSGSKLESSEGDWSAECAPRLCHGSLWPDHVIVNGTSVEGLVGWSCADFMPQSLDSWMYRLWHTGSRREQQWQEFISQTPCQDNAALTPMADEDMARYAQAVATIRAGSRATKSISDKAEKLIQNINILDYPHLFSRAPLSGASSAVGSTSDARSLATLTDQTIDTWEQFTTATEATIKPCRSSISSARHISTVRM